MARRTIAIGDIHGCSAALSTLIEAIVPGPDDLVVTLGDYVDRGPDSRGVIEMLRELSGRCRLVPLMGNHDRMFLDALGGRSSMAWLDVGGRSTVESYGRDLGLVPAEHVEFLRACPLYHETDSHIFVHASYQPELAMDRQPPYLILWESLRGYVPGPHESGKRVVVGHSSQKEGRVLDLGHLICIDTYCWGGGWLTALDVETGRTWQADRVGRMRDDADAVAVDGNGR